MRAKFPLGNSCDQLSLDYGGHFPLMESATNRTLNLGEPITKMKVFKRILLIFLAILVIGCALFVVLAKNYVNDNSISTGEIASSNDRVLFVFAHPDDEITVAGTLAKLKSKGSETGVIYLTRGEAGVTGGLVPKEKLGERRTEEAKSIQ